MNRFTVMLLAALLLPAGAVRALELKGVKVPETAAIEPGAAALVLNGAGVRSKFFVSVYVGALYLPARRSDAAAVLDTTEPRRVAMHFVYDAVEARKLRDAWEEGFVDNQSPEALAALRERLERFKALFGDAVAGDVVWLDFVPGHGTTVSFNGEAAGTIPGDDFNRALLAVWLGVEPADSGLKRGMLGDD
jgi:hypothetical protein